MQLPEKIHPHKYKVVILCIHVKKIQLNPTWLVTFKSDIIAPALAAYTQKARVPVVQTFLFKLF